MQIKQLIPLNIAQSPQLTGKTVAVTQQSGNAISPAIRKMTEFNPDYRQFAQGVRNLLRVIPSPQPYPYPPGMDHIPSGQPVRQRQQDVALRRTCLASQQAQPAIIQNRNGTTGVLNQSLHIRVP